jgi:predicted NBD/HSP70 family sugar kinase
LDREFLIGIELNSQEIKGGLVDLNGKVVKKIVVPSEAKKGKKKVIENLISVINKLKKEDIVGVGIAIPGFVDRKKGIVTETDIPGFNNLSLKQILFESLHIPVFLENYSNCIVMAEHRTTFARKIKNMIAVNIDGTVSAGIIANGKLYRGTNNIIGRIEHFKAMDKGEKCECKGQGCLTLYASEHGMILRYKKLAKKQKSIEEILELGKKDKKAKQIIADAANALGTVTAHVANILDPEVIVISGKISKSKEFMEILEKKVAEKVHEVVSRRLSIVPSDLEDAGILGASSIVMMGDFE